MWCLLNNKAPTDDNLQIRSIHGPLNCFLCKENYETIDQQFLLCPVAQYVWNQLYQSLEITSRWKGETLCRLRNHGGITQRLIKSTIVLS